MFKFRISKSILSCKSELSDCNVASISSLSIIRWESLFCTGLGYNLLLFASVTQRKCINEEEMRR
jgi:hypothetical protein